MSSVNARPALKILYHHRTQGRGAEGVHIASIVNALENLGHKVVVVSPPGVDPLSTAGNAPVDKSIVATSGVGTLWKFISKQLPNFAFELIEIIYNLPAFWRLYRTMSKGSYDLIYERYAFYLIAGAWASRWFRVPLVLEANEVSGINDRARKQSFKWLCSIFERFLFKRCISILTVSSHLKEMVLCQGIDENRIKVVPNAIDPKKFENKPEISAKVKQYRLEDKIVMGFAGWFDDWDRLDLLVEAFYDLYKQNSSLILMLIGDGPVLKEVKNIVNRYGLEEAVIFTGAVSRSEISNFLSLLDIAVMTHSNEFGSPVVMFEFMGLKIPLVAPKLVPILDVLDDGKSALLFDVLDMAQMKSCLSELIADRDKRTALADTAYNLLLEKHTWTSNAQIIVDQLVRPN